jgi:hypothetical protein
MPSVRFPPVIPPTCQVTAELIAFCTFAVKCTWSPANGCAEAGDTVIVTGGGGGGAPEDTRPLQEIKNIASSGESRKRNERRERNARGSMTSCGW